MSRPEFNQRQHTVHIPLGSREQPDLPDLNFVESLFVFFSSLQGPAKSLFAWWWKRSNICTASSQRAFALMWLVNIVVLGPPVIAITLTVVLDVVYVVAVYLVIPWITLWFH
jgi:hypothetical protein